MRRVIALALVLGFSFAVPAFADDQTPAQFRALAGVLDGNRAAPVPMTDEQLAAVEGEGFCLICVNSASVGQVNANSSLFSRVRQTNVAVVKQSIN